MISGHAAAAADNARQRRQRAPAQTTRASADNARSADNAPKAQLQPQRLERWNDRRDLFGLVNEIHALLLFVSQRGGE